MVVGFRARRQRISANAFLLGFFLPLLSILQQQAVVLHRATAAPTFSTSHDAKYSVASANHGPPTRVVGYGKRGNSMTPEQRPILEEEHANYKRLWYQESDAGLKIHSCLFNMTILVQSDGSLRIIDEPFDLPHLYEWNSAEGIYGIYSVPSGPLVVLITDSVGVYEAPRVQGQYSWFSIRKVQQLTIRRVRSLADRVDSALESSDVTLTRAEMQEEQRQLSLLRHALKHHEWYFCASQACGNSGRPIVPDMTNRLQVCFRQLTLDHQNNESLHVPWYDIDNNSTLHPDSRFFWNQELVEPLRKIYSDENNTAARVLLEHVIPVTSAFCGVQTNMTTTSSESNRALYDELLITRRSRFRTGTRFTKRGADSSGAVANYAETEQILFLYNCTDNTTDVNITASGDYATTLSAVYSHVQTRGSIPLRWSSPTDIKTYRPRVRIGTDPLAQARALLYHVKEQMKHYVLWSPPVENLQSTIVPSLVFVNLVDKKSDQGRLGKAFDSVLSAVLDVYNETDDTQPWINSKVVHHIWFDFHAEVKHGRWDRLLSLLDEVKGPLADHSYLKAVPIMTSQGFTFSMDRLQSGVIRTNCMDCLDRTNVVQSIFGRFVLFSQLSDAAKSPLLAQSAVPLGFKTAFRSNPLSLPWRTGEFSHRLLWADNADAISRLYAGTPALKGDFTRTGKRTKKGAIDDGMNSLQRYYLNNFMDADRQEGMDLLVGYQPFGFRSMEDTLWGQPEFSNNLIHRGMSLREAARKALLGNWGKTGHGTNDNGDGNHVRIKIKNNARTLRKLPAFGGTHYGGHQLSLDFRWLPGDLQSQVRRKAETFGVLSPDFDPDSMQALDGRAASDVPWWVTDSSSDEETGVYHTVDQDHEVVPAAVHNNGGFLFGAIVAASTSGVGTAAVVLGLLSLWFPSLTDTGSNTTIV